MSKKKKKNIIEGKRYEGFVDSLVDLSEHPWLIETAILSLAEMLEKDNPKMSRSIMACVIINVFVGIIEGADNFRQSYRRPVYDVLKDNDIAFD